MSYEVSLSIDLGTTYNCVGVWKKAKMLCPFDDGTGTHCLQADDETVILLTHFVSPHTRSRPVSKPLLPGSLRAPRATPAKDLADSLPEVPPTVPDSPDGEDGKTNTQMASQAEHNEMELDKEKKRKSDEASSETHAAKLSKKQQPFELVECGGGGACGFNSIAVGMALNHGKDRRKTLQEAASLGAQLRVLLNTYLENKGWFARHFVPNQGTEVICGGPIPATWSEYVEAVLRPTFWCDALCLLGLARRLKQKFIVVMYNPTTAQWEKRAVLGNSKNIIVLALQDNHYRLVLPTNDHPLPEEWISAPEDLDLGCIDLTGGMAPSRASWIPATSPSKARPSWIPSTSSGGTTSGPSAAPKSASTKSRKIIGAAKNHSSLPKFPASTNSRVWWKCPACDFVLEYKNGNHLHNQGLYKRKSKHLKLVHGAPVTPAPKQDAVAIANQVQSRVQQQIRTYSESIPWLIKQKWKFAHRMAGKPAWVASTKYGRDKLLVDTCLDCQKKFRLHDIFDYLCPGVSQNGKSLYAEKKKLRPSIPERKRKFKEQRDKLRKSASSAMRAAQIARKDGCKKPKHWTSVNAWKVQSQQLGEVYVPAYRRSDRVTANEQFIPAARITPKLSG